MRIIDGDIEVRDIQPGEGRRAEAVLTGEQVIPPKQHGVKKELKERIRQTMRNCGLLPRGPADPTLKAAIRESIKRGPRRQR